MNMHLYISCILIGLPIWYVIGILVYMLKRAYYLVTGPNPVATSYTEFIQKCWIPLLVRAVVDSGLFWLMFYPEILNPLLTFVGINFQLNFTLMNMPGPVTLFVGLGIDSIVDFGISKIPYLKDWLPQMPPPIKTA